MGALLIALAGLILVEDRWFMPFFPIFLVTVLAACLAGTNELLNLFDSASRPNKFLCYLGVAGMILLNGQIFLFFPLLLAFGMVFFTVGLLAMLVEMANFRGPDRICERLGQTLLTIFYLGLLPSFFVRIRFYSADSNLALALVVFVPKGCDIGAYFVGKYLTGRWLGRTPMTPILSPKKTWQGAIGGLLAACGVAVALGSTGDIFPNLFATIAFGLIVGVAGMFGDLFESMLKRDRETKDASASIPGFGGVLDVIDSLLFAAPVAYLLLEGFLFHRR